MDKKEQVKICKQCLYHTFSLEKGVLCQKNDFLDCVENDFSMFNLNEEEESIADKYTKRTGVEAPVTKEQLKQAWKFPEEKKRIDKEFAYKNLHHGHDSLLEKLKTFKITDIIYALLTMLAISFLFSLF